MQLDISFARNVSDDDIIIERLHSRLRNYLEDYGLATETVRRTEIEPGARGAGDIVLGFFQIVVSPAIGAVVGALVTAAVDFHKSSPDRSVTVRYGDREITIKNSSTADIRALVKELLAGEEK